jgi:hypothetical protein
MPQPQEITLGVFIILARKANSLSPKSPQHRAPEDGVNA